MNTPQLEAGRSISVKKTLVICGVILAVAIGVTLAIYFSEPQAERTSSSKRTAMLVEVITVEKGAYRPLIEVLGRVEPALEIMLSPQVSGKIVFTHPEFAPGGFVQKSQRLIQIDSADYQHALTQQRGRLQQAQADLIEELGRQEVAKQDYELLGEELNEENKSLVLRQHKVQAAKAEVESAQAAVNQAQLNLNRTAITAPFDAQIIQRNANLGSQVSPGDPVARLVGIDQYWIMASVPLTKLQWLEPASREKGGSKARIRSRASWPQGVYRDARLKSIVGALDDESRLAKVILTVQDPLSLQAGPDVPPLMIDSIVQVLISGKELVDVVRIKRDYLRNQNTVWVMAEDKLDIRSVTVMATDAEYAYIKEGLSEGDQIVATNLSTVTQGAPLRVEESEDS